MAIARDGEILESERISVHVEGFSELIANQRDVGIDEGLRRLCGNACKVPEGVADDTEEVFPSLLTIVRI